MMSLQVISTAPDLTSADEDVTYTIYNPYVLCGTCHGKGQQRKASYVDGFPSGTTHEECSFCGGCGTVLAACA
jgi:DnaJ-class molecular chaperone